MRASIITLVGNTIRYGLYMLPIVEKLKFLPMVEKDYTNVGRRIVMRASIITLVGNTIRYGLYMLPIVEKLGSPAHD